eukprot:UN00057
MHSFGEVSVQEQDNILILRMHGGLKGQNAINIKFVCAFLKALDFCESTKGEKTLIVTGKADKFFCVGFDFEELFERRYVNDLVGGLMKICKRLLTFPLPTISAINGHCYAGGVMLAAACDWRIMLNNCGDFCLSEVNLGLSIPIWADLLSAKMTPNALRTAALTGKKFSCKEALDEKLIDEMVMNRSDLMKRSVEFGKTVAKFSKNRANYSRLKYDMYYQAVDVLNYAIINKYPSKL